jgi:hypothetical protein
MSHEKWCIFVRRLTWLGRKRSITEINGAKVPFFNILDLVNQLELDKNQQKFKLTSQVSKYDVLILDERGGCSGNLNRPISDKTYSPSQQFIFESQPLAEM